MLTYGFFNSLNNDRKYNAEQMAYIIDALVNDGVMQNYGEYLAVKPGNGMSVVVEKGMAWFDSTWTRNDGQIVLDIDPADVTLARYDAVVLEVDRSVAVRANSIKVVKGVASSAPAKPTMVKSSNINQYPLAYVKVEPSVTSISSSSIEIRVGQSDCPWITGILQTVPIDTLFAEWDGEFNTWFENLQAMLDDNVVANLQSQIDELNTKVEEKADKAGKTVEDLTTGYLCKGASNDELVVPGISMSNVSSSSYYSAVDNFLIYGQTSSNGPTIFAKNMTNGTTTSLIIGTSTDVTPIIYNIHFDDNSSTKYFVVGVSGYYYVVKLSSSGTMTRVGQAQNRTPSIYMVGSYFVYTYAYSSGSNLILYYINKTASSSTNWTEVSLPISYDSNLHNYICGTYGSTIVFLSETSYLNVSLITYNISTKETSSRSLASISSGRIYAFPLFQNDRYIYAYIVKYVSSKYDGIHIYKIDKSNSFNYSILDIPQSLLLNISSAPSNAYYLFSTSSSCYIQAWYNKAYNKLIRIDSDFTTYTVTDSFLETSFANIKNENEIIVDEDSDVVAISNWPVVFSLKDKKTFPIYILYANSSSLPTSNALIVIKTSDSFGIFSMFSLYTDMSLYALDVPNNVYLMINKWKITNFGKADS